MANDSLFRWGDGLPYFASQLYLSNVQQPKSKIWRLQYNDIPTHPFIAHLLPSVHSPMWHTKMRKIPHKIPMLRAGTWVYSVPFWHFYDGYRECKIPLLDIGDLAIQTSEGTKYIQFSPAWSKLQVYYNNKINYISYT